MKTTIYLILEFLAFIGAVISFSTSNLEYAALMIAFIAFFSVRRLEVKLEEDE